MKSTSGRISEANVNSKRSNGDNVNSACIDICGIGVEASAALYGNNGGITRGKLSSYYAASLMITLICHRGVQYQSCQMTEAM